MAYDQQNSPLIRVCGLWENQTKNNQTFYSGTLGDAKIMIFKNNKKKEGSKQPDLFLNIGVQKKKTETPDPAVDKDIPF